MRVLRELRPGGPGARPDHRYLGEQADKFCADEDACAGNRERRYPPDMSRVPSWVLTAGSEAAEQEAAGALVRAAATAAPRAYYLELTAAAEPDGEEIALAGQPVPLPGWQATPSGAWDTRGDFIPVNFNWAHWNWRHTIRGGARMSHAISGGAPPPGGGGARLAALRAGRRQQLQAQRAAGPNPPSYGSEPAQEGQRGQRGPEIPPEGAPARPGQQRAPAPRRRGRRALLYSPRRRPSRQPPHPGTDGSDSFHAGGADTGGPSGGSAET